MQYRQLGRSGLTVSAYGLGCIQFGRKVDFETAHAIVEEALEAGVTYLDTANSYGQGESERMLGEILGSRRQRVVISTKFGSRRLRRADNALASRRGIRMAVEESLARLRTDYIDLYQIHFPDPFTPIEETLAALDELIQEGKVRYIGSSNFEAWQIVEAEWVARSQGGQRLISAQREYGFLNREIEADVVPVCLKYGIGLLPWRPISNGLLAGRYKRGDQLPASTNYPPPVLTDGDWTRVERLERFAAERGIGILDLAIGGLAAMPGVASVQVGVSRPEQVAPGARAAEWIPTPADLDGIREILGTSVRLGES